MQIAEYWPRAVDNCDMPQAQLDRIRAICLALPDSSERISHGEPTFFVHKKVFVMFANNHHGDGRIAIWIPLPQGMQSVLISSAPTTFFKPPYVGVKGWVGIELAHISDADLAYHVRTAWGLIAPKSLLVN